MMKRLFLLACLLCVLTPSFAQKNNADTRAIRQVMQEQQDAWNRGDLEAFMQGYWQSDSLRFIGSRGLS